MDTYALGCGGADDLPRRNHRHRQLGNWSEVVFIENPGRFPARIFSNILEAQVFQEIHRSSHTPDLMHVNVLVRICPFNKENDLLG